MSERSQTTDVTWKNFTKSVQNLTVGYLGIKPSQGKYRYFLTNRWPKNAGVYLNRQIERNLGVEDISDGELLYVYGTLPVGRPTWREINRLAAHVAVIEYGKLHLVKFINFLQANLPPGSFLWLYSCVDNVHIAAASEDWSLLVPEDKRQDFLQELSRWVSKDKEPGRFKLEWSASDSFRYCTASIQNFGVVDCARPQHKSAGLNNLTDLKSYELSCRMLQMLPVSVVQERRVDKIVGLATAKKTIVFGKLQL